MFDSGGVASPPIADKIAVLDRIDQLRPEVVLTRCSTASREALPRSVTTSGQSPDSFTRFSATGRALAG